MGFFNKLKDKIFGKKENSQIIDATKTKEEKFNFKAKKDSLFEESNKVDKYVAGLDKSRTSITSRINNVFIKYKKIDEDFFDSLEEELIISDLGYNMTSKIVEEVKKQIFENNIVEPSLIKEVIADRMFVMYSNNSFINTSINFEEGKLKVILMTGVNGGGKTTTVAKLAYKLKTKGAKVILAAGDTFRAAAEDQLEHWAKQVGVECVRGSKEGQDPASVVFDAVTRAKKEDFNILIVDTAGRLQNKKNLMLELEKINKVLEREVNKEDIETLLVVDAMNGQNSLMQAKEFSEIINIDGLVLTKMDGTAKGGIVLNIKEQLNIPVKYIGLGESLDDLQEFDLENYIYGIFKEWADAN